MAIRSRLFGLAASLPAGSTTVLVSVPAGRTAVVRQWQVMGRTGAAQEVEVAIRRAGSVVRISALTGLAAGQYLRSWADDLVLNPGDELVVLAAAGNTSGSLTAYASGSLLFGEPE